MTTKQKAPCVRERVWVPRKMGSAPGPSRALPGIVVGQEIGGGNAGLVLVRHSGSATLPAAIVDSGAMLPGLDEVTWTVEPFGGRVLRPRHPGYVDKDGRFSPRHEFDQWAPAAGFLRWNPKRGKRAPFWSLSLRSRLDLPWLVVHGQGGDLGTLLDSARTSVSGEGHTFPPLDVEPNTPMLCPADDVDRLPMCAGRAMADQLVADTAALMRSGPAKA